ncbi:hypothetical protein GCM10009826_26380 [Humibacillus xanthopallidus]
MLVIVIAFLSITVVVGSDAFWLVALGDTIIRDGQVPVGLPFAVADSTGWVNVPVLGEVMFSLANRLGPVGLPMLQLAADATALGLVAVGARRLGAGRGPTAGAVSLVVIGALPAFGVVRSQLYSLVPFALLLLLLRTEYRRPTARIWLALPLLAIWGNLHGAVLVGLAVTGAYLLFARLRTDPWTAFGVGLGALAALFFTPAHIQTGAYYYGVLTNEAASRRSELWATPQLTQPFDVLLVGAAAVLAVSAVRQRLPAWEYVVLAGLGVGTLLAARHGVWLLLFSAPLAASAWSVRSRRSRTTPPQSLRPATVAITAAVVAAGCGLVLWLRTPAFDAHLPVVVAVDQRAQGRTVLATEPLAESLAAAGTRVWAANPIDAFSRGDQSAFLDFLAGVGNQSSPALDSASLVVAPTGSDASRLAAQAGFDTVQQIGGYDLMERPARP